MAGTLIIKRSWRRITDDSLIKNELIPFDQLDDFLKATFNLGAIKIEVHYFTTKMVYEIDK
jgi:hypothetical protein